MQSLVDLSFFVSLKCYRDNVTNKGNVSDKSHLAEMGFGNPREVRCIVNHKVPTESLHEQLNVTFIESLQPELYSRLVICPSRFVTVATQGPKHQIKKSAKVIGGGG